MKYTLNLFKEPYPYNWKYLPGFFKNIRNFSVFLAAFISARQKAIAIWM